MQNNCTNGKENRYRLCRVEAGKYNDVLSSRAGAAELLNVSESSLRNYETGLALVPEDVVVRMADLYNAPELESYYCQNDCPIGRHLKAPLSCEIKHPEQVACNFLYHADNDKLEEIRKMILRIASDGKITDSEKTEMQEAVSYLENLCRDISDMRLLLKKRDCNG